MYTLTINDETASGKLLNEISLQFEKEYISVEELIKSRIEQEVKKYQDRTESYRNGLVLPEEIEQRLNRKPKIAIDLEKQVYIALDAFNKNGYFILVDDEQVDELDQKFLIDKATKVSFIKLTPLVGG